MSVRYSQTRLAATAQVKRVCLAAVMHLHCWATRSDVVLKFEHLSACIKSLDRLEARTRRPTWGELHEQSAGVPVEVPMVEDLAADTPHEDSDASGSSTSSSSSSASSTDEEFNDIPEHLAANIPWIAPLRSQQLHVRRQASDEEEAMSVCIGRVYAVGFELGTGAAAAAETGRTRCAACLRRLHA